jgi:hypothetical protein
VFTSKGDRPARLAEIQRVQQRVVVRGMIALAGDPRCTPAVQSRVEAVLSALEATPPPPDPVWAAHYAGLVRDIRRHFATTWTVPPAVPTPPAPPPGDPIGASVDQWGPAECGF